MTKHFGLISRILLAQIFFISILFILNNIISTPGGYGMYQDMLGARGLPESWHRLVFSFNLLVV